MTTNPHFIKYHGYYSGRRGLGGMTSLYDTPEEALACARACSFKEDTVWVSPVFCGLHDTVLRATVPIEYIDWKPTPTRQFVATGETFVVGDLMVADHQITRAVIGSWIVDGKVEVV